MKIRRHYLALRALYPQIGEREPLEVTTQELAEALDCTHRNMVLLLQRMQRENWIGWEPKRGRGNRSVLRFLAGKEELLLAEAQDIAERQDLQRAVSYLQEMDDDAGGLRNRFQAWLSGRFGFQSEVRGERRLDLLRFPLPQHIHSLDPADMHYAGESHLVNQLFDGLVRMSPGGEAALPHLAHAWEIDESRRRWTFFLRKGVLFHNGREMTAADVKFSFERLKRLAPKGLFNWVYGEIAAIDTPNERTVTFRLRSPNELFLPFLTTNRASIVPAADEPREDALFGLQPVGTGPFRLAGSEHGIFTLEAFDAYFHGRGFLDVVEVWTESGSTRGSDEPEGLPVFEVMHNVRLSGPASQRLQQVRQSGMTCKFVTVNELRDGPLRNPALRQAFDAALNRASLIERLSGDVIEAANSFWPDFHGGVPLGTETRATEPDQTTRHGANRYEAVRDGAELHGAPDTAPCDPPSASELLASAGYAGERIVLATIPQYKADAELVRDECAASGIRLDIELIPAEIFKGESRLAADLLLFAVMLDEHRELRLIELFKSMLHHLLPETQRDMERRIDALLMLHGAEQRTAALLAIEHELRSTHRLLFLYRKHLKTAFHPSIRGISLESLGWVRFRDLWFKPEELANG
ncbi:ABC transporter substrate-binding protein [Paenibacillus glycinis]|uniref:ABC transporter substrate-binding protein n=1 Tax=Paenibacillus glycinis TaxID=2697035 RepID=A0ABW9XL22_9BACL|nr:ABC transporter substrate-binding protein [Paenibacillus glycinis]NBD23310.1 ABC transporter substrate-binding protein [Paenibacillus glycinis]